MKWKKVLFCKILIPLPAREILFVSRLIFYYVKNDIEGKLISDAVLFIEIVASLAYPLIVVLKAAFPFVDIMNVIKDKTFNFDE